MKFFLRVLAVLTVGLTLLGIFWAPKDVEDWRTAAEPWQRFIGMFDQNTLLWIFSLSLFAWFVWSQLWPSVRSFIEHPLKLTWPTPDMYGTADNGEAVLLTPLQIANNSSKHTIEDVEIRILRVGQRKPIVHGASPVNERLALRSSGERTFKLLPKMPREVAFLRQRMKMTPGDLPRINAIELGPLESGGYFALRGNGLHKIDVAIYGAGVSPRHESLMIGIDGAFMTFGFWRDDMPWPFAERVDAEPTTSEAPSSQSPQDTEPKTPR